MKGCLIFACAAILGAAPASAATIMLEAEGAEHSAGFNLGMFLGEGVYAARFLLDRAAQPGSMLTFIHGVSYDFYGVADGIHYGGNDVPTFRDHAFTGTAFSRILKVQRPYQLVSNWGGDIGDIEERGYFYLDAVYGDLYFAGPGPVRLDYSFERVSEVPEPSRWAMLVSGFGLAGWLLRRRLKRFAQNQNQPRSSRALPLPAGRALRINFSLRLKSRGAGLAQTCLDFARHERKAVQINERVALTRNALPERPIFAKLLSARSSGGKAAFICR